MNEYNVGDIVETKKQHPCGSKLWEVTRVGVDFKLKCQGCGHVIMIDREKALKAIKKKVEKKTKTLLFKKSCTLRLLLNESVFLYFLFIEA